MRRVLSWLSRLAARIGPGWLLAAAIVLVAVCALHWEVVFGGQIYHMDDAADGYYPSHIAIARAYSHWELPTWDRQSWAGWPLDADPYYGSFYPLFLIFFVCGAARGLGLTVALHAVGGGWGMLWLMRRRGASAPAGLVAALALSLSSFFVVRIRHVIFLEALAWMPVLLACCEAWLTERRRWALGGAALCAGMIVLCGALPLLLFLALFAGAYAIARLWSVDRPLEAGVGLLVAGVIGLVVGMAQLLPTAAHVPSSPRALATDYSFASSYAWPSWRYLVTLLMPDWFGGEDRSGWFGVFNHWEMAGYYIGAVAILLAGVGLVRMGRRQRPMAVALATVSLMAVLLALGDHGPLHGFFFRHVPLYATLRCPTRALVMFVLAVPLLAAEAVDFLVTEGSRRWMLGAGGVTALGAAVALYLSRPRFLYTWDLTAAARRALATGPVPALGGLLSAHRFALLHLAVVLAALAGVLLLVGFRILTGARAAWLVALLSAGDLLVVDRGYVQPQPADYAVGMERFAAVDWLIGEQQRNPTSDRFAPDPHGPFRLHNVGMTYDLPGASGYDSVSVWRYVNFLQVLNNGHPYASRALKDDLAAGDIVRFDSPLVDLLNVRWAIAQAPPARGWTRRFAPSTMMGRPGDPLHAKYEPRWDPLLSIWENPHPLPRAFVVFRATVVDDAHAVAKLPTLDPRVEALVDAAPAIPPSGAALPPAPARLRVAERQKLIIDVDAPAAGILVVSETHYPGWSALLDGKSVPLLRADYTFRGVAVPAGRHVVEMRFVSRPTQIGLLLSALGFVLAGWALFSQRRRRK